MPIRRFRAERFRCLLPTDVELAPDYNLVYGRNASGKTSFLEALAYLGRGKSFRGAPTGALVQHGSRDFVLFGRVAKDGREFGVGVENGPGGLVARVDGANGASAELADALPLQIIDPDVHNLVSGGPEERRRFVDWVTFHVEPTYVDAWRQFRRALKQRNAALRSASPKSVLASWDVEFVRLALSIDRLRRAALDAVMPALTRHSEALLESAIGFEYAQGWATGSSLEEALSNGFDRDVQQGSTQSGPHRADLKLKYDERQAKRLVSRGQQKLLAAAMVLAATETARQVLGRDVLLLMDDPAAELDRDSLERLMQQSLALGCQVVCTSLEPDTLSFPSAPRTFHVEHGQISQIS